MNIIAILIPLSASVAAVFLVLFVLAAINGQFDDLNDAAWRVLDDDD